MDHDGSLGLVISFDEDGDDRFGPVPKVLFANGTRDVFPHLLEVVSASR
jgi:hypothetical protein